MLNVVETGHVLGHGGGRVEQTASPSFPRSLVTGFRVLYRLLDLSGYGVLTAFMTMIAGCLLLLVTYPFLRRHGRGALSAAGGAAATALPLLAPMLVLALALLAREFARAFDVPVGSVSARVSEDFSAFGVLGGLVLVSASLYTIRSAKKQQRDMRFLALALALPVFLLLLALTSKYNPFLSRFLLVPAALTAPLFGDLFRRRVSILAIVMVAATTLALTSPVRAEAGPTGAVPAPQRGARRRRARGRPVCRNREHGRRRRRSRLRSRRLGTAAPRHPTEPSLLDPCNRPERGKRTLLFGEGRGSGHRLPEGSRARGSQPSVRQDDRDFEPDRPVLEVGPRARRGCQEEEAPRRVRPKP